MGLTALGKADEKNTGKMGEILEKLMKKYWKNAKNTGKVYEKILEKCKKNWESQGNSSVQKSGNHASSRTQTNERCHLLSYNYGPCEVISPKKLNMASKIYISGIYHCHIGHFFDIFFPANASYSVLMVIS